MKLSRHFRILLIVSILLCLASTSSVAVDQKGDYLFYVGTYTEHTKSKGIYAYRYDSQSGKFESLGLAAETVNPSWIAFDPSGRFLYAVNEVPNYQGPNSGGVSAFSIDHATGKLTFLNEVASRGADPCYVAVDKTGKYVLVANYTGGSIAVFPILPDGKLGEASAFIQHTGHGPNPQRQEGPHAHSIDLSADNRFVYVDDLGLDELLVYKFDDTKGTLTPDDPPFAKLDPGAGPRHFALRPDQKFAYVVSEMGRSVTVFSNDAATGRLQSLQTVSTVPAEFTGRNDDAEIHVSPSGKFLYASNRGEDTIAVFGINGVDGKVAPVGRAPTGGKEPRSFEIDPSRKRIFAENQKSDTIVIFKIESESGRLTDTGQMIKVASPVCLKFLAIR